MAQLVQVYFTSFKYFCPLGVGVRVITKSDAIINTHLYSIPPFSIAII